MRKETERFRVCVDASLAILWLVPAQRSAQADDLLEHWIANGTRLIGPPLFDVEVTSTIRRFVHLKMLLPEEGEEVFAAYSALGIQTVSQSRLSKRAWELAKQYNRPRTYDMQYLALAELEGCELWTADINLVNSLGSHETRVHQVK